MGLLRRKTVFKLPASQTGIPDGLQSTPLPVSCLPGGENEALYQQAFIDLTTADDPAVVAAATQALTQLGIEPVPLTTDQPPT